MWSQLFPIYYTLRIHIIWTLCFAYHIASYTIHDCYFASVKGTACHFLSQNNWITSFTRYNWECTLIYISRRTFSDTINTQPKEYPSFIDSTVLSWVQQGSPFKPNTHHAMHWRGQKETEADRGPQFLLKNEFLIEVYKETKNLVNSLIKVRVWLHWSVWNEMPN